MDDVVFEFTDDSTGVEWPPLELVQSFQTPSAGRVWLQFGLTVAGCAIGGLCLGYMAAAVLLDRMRRPH